MLTEQDNCGADLPNKTKVGLQGEVFCVWSGPWKWTPGVQKKGCVLHMVKQWKDTLDGKVVIYSIGWKKPKLHLDESLV